MTRTKCAAAVLIVTAVIVFSGFILNIRTVDSIYSDISSAFESLENGNQKKAELYTDSALAKWNNKLRILMVFNSHNKTNEIDQSLKLASTSLSHDNTEVFITESKRALILLRHLKENEYPTIDNIL